MMTNVETQKQITQLTHRIFNVQLILTENNPFTDITVLIDEVKAIHSKFDKSVVWTGDVTRNSDMLNDFFDNIVEVKESLQAAIKTHLSLLTANEIEFTWKEREMKQWAGIA